MISHTKHTQHTQWPADLHTHINLYLNHLLCAHGSYLYYIEWCVNKQNRHIHTPNTKKKDNTRKCQYEDSDTHPFSFFFLNNLTYFTNHSIFMGKIWTLHFFKNIENSIPLPPSLERARGEGVIQFKHFWQKHIF